MAKLPLTKPQATESLFDPETYRGATVTMRENQTIRVENVRGEPLTLTFERRVHHWSVCLKIVAIDQETGHQALIMDGCEATPEHQHLWAALQDMAFHHSTGTIDRLRQRTISILAKP